MEFGEKRMKKRSERERDNYFIGGLHKSPLDNLSPPPSCSVHLLSCSFCPSPLQDHYHRLSSGMQKDLARRPNVFIEILNKLAIKYIHFE